MNTVTTFALKAHKLCSSYSYIAFKQSHLLAAAMMSNVYDDHKDEDGFLYITYSGENTFG